ncbi:MAG: hypothetical protein JNM09_15745 [Blastocatellia bacterium]|nr:hypothetical protein [Blastocatellia bacterium]
MQAINVETTADRFLISIDKNLMTKEMLLRLLNQLRLESLAQRVDFDESVEDLGEEIKDSWWQQNKARLLQGAE